MHADVGVEGTACDGEGVPLVAADLWEVQEEPLSGFVAHRWLVELDLDGICCTKMLAQTTDEVED